MTGQHRNHPARPGYTDPGDAFARAEVDSSARDEVDAPARAEVLLRATHEFLRSDDPRALGRAMVDAVSAMVGDSKVAVTFAQPNGSMALVSTAGYWPDEVERLSEVVPQDAGMFHAISGTELWSDDPGPGALMDWTAKWGCRSGLSIPISTTAGAAGNLSLMFDDERAFDPGLRDAIRSLAAQAGLALELIAARDALQRVARGRVDAVADLKSQRELLTSAVAERTVQLRQANAELRSANEAKTEFLSNVSHELRTPLTAILGYTEMLVGGDDGPLNPRQFEDATTVLASGRRLLELIDDLIVVSRIEADQLELEIRPMPLQPLLTSVVEELRALAGAKGIEMTFRPIPEPVVLDGDERRLHEVFLNLISNAVKFTRPGGSVRVEVGLEASPVPGDRGVRIDVIDTGIGIAASEQERIFQKFNRVAGPEYPGTGLGLAIARAFVARHGGSVTVESTVGLGSRFSVVLPLAQVAVPLA